MRSQLKAESDQMGSQLKLGSRVLNFCRLSMMTRYTAFADRGFAPRAAAAAVAVAEG
jgi:hypothetical protein